MAYKLQIKRGLLAVLPIGISGEPIFTTDTNDLYIGNGTSNQRFQKYIASGTSSQFLKGDGSLDSTTYQPLLTNPVTGIGTTNYLPKWTSGSALGNSAITDDGTTVTLISRALSGTSGTFSGSVNAASFIPTSSSIPTNGMYLAGTNVVGFSTNTTSQMLLNAAGILGLGAVPSAWASNFKALQMTSGVALISHPTVPICYLGANYLASDTGSKYISSDFASRFLVNAFTGGFSWDIAPSGTAGSAISFTQAMTLGTNSGLSIGTTTAAAANGLLVAGAATFSSSVTALGIVTASSTSGGTSAIFQNTGAQNSNGIELRGGTLGTAVNWKIQKDNTVANAFQLTPSTTNGGTTYTTPVLSITSLGAATFSNDVTASSFIKSGGTSSQYLMADGSVTTGGGGGSVDELQVSLICQVFG